MKRINLLLLICLVCVLPLTIAQSGTAPRVFVFTDINIDAGDSDDHQSLIPLF